MAAAVAGLALAACSSGGGDEARTLNTAEFQTSRLNAPQFLASAPDVKLFVGAAVADEPRAALAARDVLEAGGTATDAATAAYFTLAVTMPHAAGLGGGGLCLVHDPEARSITSYDFLPRRSAGGGPVGIPGNVRGFALMHATHGQFPWSRLVAPAEVMAAQGHEISRAFARELAGIAPAIATQPPLAALYLGPGGRPLQEGDLLVQPGLAASIGKVRANGPSGFYTGAVADSIVESAAGIGGTISRAELRAYRPNAREAQTVVAGDNVVALPAADLGAGRLMGAVWAEAARGARADALLAAVRAELARAGAEDTLPAVHGSTAFTVATAGGDAVACAVTMNGPFGAGRLIAGTGLTLPRAPDAPGFGLSPAFLAPMMIANPNNGRFFFAGAAAGGPRAPAAVAQLAANTILGSATLDAAQASGLSDAQSLANAIACPRGAPQENASCSFAADPRGAGLGALGYPAGL